MDRNNNKNSYSNNNNDKNDINFDLTYLINLFIVKGDDPVKFTATVRVS